jgi:hypothetical protein
MTNNYQQLVSCEKELRNNLITKTVRSNFTTKTSQYRLRAYRLLTHAEIESYIEGLILLKINIEKIKWATTKIIPNCFASIMAYSKQEFPNISNHLAEITTRNDITFRTTTIINNFEAMIKRNNGIKEENIIPLIVPLGIDYSNISQTLLNNLSSFGQNRGNTAHNSSKVQSPINPVDETNIINQIVQEIQTIDSLIMEIK